MRRFALVLAIAPALVFAAGCSTPQEDAEKRRERSREEIQALIEGVIAAMQNNTPDVYWDSLCEQDRNRYPVEAVREDWTAEHQLLHERTGSATVKMVGIDKDNPNGATVLRDAPNHPQKQLMFDCIRENGVWKVKHPPFKLPKESTK